MFLFFLAFYPAPFSSKHFILWLSLSPLSTQLFFLVVLLLLLLSMIAFSYVGILSLLWVSFFHALYPSHLPPSSFLVVSFFGSGLFFGIPVFRVSVLSNLQGRFRILSFFFVFFFGGGGGGSCSYSFLSLVILLISAILRAIFSFLFSGIFRVSATVLFFFLVLFFQAGLHCLLRMHTLNSCVGDTWQRLWRDDFTHNGKQVVNRLKIPQGLSTLMFPRWSEVPSRGGVRGDSP